MKENNKAELLRECIIFLIHLFARAISLMKKLTIEETKDTQYSTFKSDIMKVGFDVSISHFFIDKIALANIWINFSSSNLAYSAAYVCWSKAIKTLISSKVIINLNKEYPMKSIASCNKSNNLYFIYPCTSIFENCEYRNLKRR